MLVPTEDPEALATGIESVLARRESFDPRKLRAHALDRFGFDALSQRLRALYQEALTPPLPNDRFSRPTERGL